jgi:hypothetical protein
MRQAAKVGAAKFDAIRAMMKAPIGELPKSVGELADVMADLAAPRPSDATHGLLYAMMPETLLVISGTFEQFKLYADRFPAALRPRLKFVQGLQSVVGRSPARTGYVTIGTWGEVDSKREARRQVEDRGVARWGATAWT